MPDNITNEQIAALAAESAARGDTITERICEGALRAGPEPQVAGRAAGILATLGYRYRGTGWYKGTRCLGESAVGALRQLCADAWAALKETGTVAS